MRRAGLACTGQCVFDGSGSGLPRESSGLHGSSSLCLEVGVDVNGDREVNVDDVNTWPEILNGYWFLVDLFQAVETTAINFEDPSPFRFTHFDN